MTAATAPAVYAAATLQRDLLDEFMAVVKHKLVETPNPFARESLKDLLASLEERRGAYAPTGADDRTAA